MRLNEITCISDLYYVMGRWFTLAMVLLAMVTLPFALEVSDGVFALMMCGGVAFVGVAAEYRSESVYWVHYVSALVSVIGCVAWVVMVEPWWLLCLCCGLVGAVDRRRWLLWCEVSAFAMAYGVLLSEIGWVFVRNRMGV